MKPPVRRQPDSPPWLDKYKINAWWRQIKTAGPQAPPRSSLSSWCSFRSTNAINFCAATSMTSQRNKYSLPSHKTLSIINSLPFGMSTLECSSSPEGTRPEVSIRNGFLNTLCRVQCSRQAHRRRVHPQSRSAPHVFREASSPSFGRHHRQRPWTHDSSIQRPARRRSRLLSSARLVRESISA